MEHAKKLLEEIGMEGERVEMVFISASEGKRWAETISQMREKLKELGPNPLKQNRGSGK